jgi:hypothetical protein
MNSIDKSSENDNSLEMTDASGLIEKQSVRATFRLSADFIEALGALSAQLGIRQKSLFDHLMEDLESLHAIAARVQESRLDKTTRIQKTFVISKKSLDSLDSVSKNSPVSRDDLVEHSIQRLLPIILAERKKQNQREEAMDRIAAHFNQASELLNEIMEIVGKDDPIYKSMDTVLSAYGNAFDNLETLVNTGKRITELPMDKFQRL